ncbi:hypothetical protein CLUG_05844 [Clavispora lusitaniae ATCC 42720]|uniref:Uncharacterized protein n=1 Tax=Clavispora lusitaniae (strain ATCC 42720) TaxID=306902 RepID=C4YC27_CLAL4|nr:uncharacterized protein CLUG_05844 [Clavispora lusitaniae ATCC 42720]EEQ41716.1 hypothetical protein CLUG_05844 [Clavispora lusitaniae ATCC 42720]
MGSCSSDLLVSFLVLSSRDSCSSSTDLRTSLSRRGISFSSEPECFEVFFALIGTVCSSSDSTETFLPLAGAFSSYSDFPEIISSSSADAFPFDLPDFFSSSFLSFSESYGELSVFFNISKSSSFSATGWSAFLGEEFFSDAEVCEDGDRDIFESFSAMSSSSDAFTSTLAGATASTIFFFVFPSTTKSSSFPTTGASLTIPPLGASGMAWPYSPLEFCALFRAKSPFSFSFCSPLSESTSLPTSPLVRPALAFRAVSSSKVVGGAGFNSWPTKYIQKENKMSNKR